MRCALRWMKRGIKDKVSRRARVHVSARARFAGVGQATQPLARKAFSEQRSNYATSRANNAAALLTLRAAEQHPSSSLAVIHSFFFFCSSQKSPRSHPCPFLSMPPLHPLLTPYQSTFITSTRNLLFCLFTLVVVGTGLVGLNWEREIQRPMSGGWCCIACC